MSTDPRRATPQPPSLELTISTLLNAAAIAFGRVLGTALAIRLVVAAFGWAW